jgi:hypothetical protein
MLERISETKHRGIYCQDILFAKMGCTLTLHSTLCILDFHKIQNRQHLYYFYTLKTLFYRLSLRLKAHYLYFS